MAKLYAGKGSIPTARVILPLSRRKGDNHWKTVRVISPNRLRSSAENGCPHLQAEENGARTW